MYYVGIDISKYKHDCTILNEHGEVIKSNFTFLNNLEGFTMFIKIVKSLGNPKNVKIGFESTSHYMNNLMKFLRDNKYKFSLVNPLLVSRFRKSNTLRNNKTDKIDSKLIALYLSQTNNENYELDSSRYLQLKKLTRTRIRLIKNRSYYLVMLTNMLDETFPEYKDFFKGSIKSKTSMFILRNWGSASKIARISKESYEKIKDVSYGKFTYPMFIRLTELAKQSIGNSSYGDELIIKTYVKLYDELDKEIAKVEEKITSIMDLIDSPIASIPGLGVISAASILGEFGSFDKYKSPSKMLAFAGLEPGKSQSGTSDKEGKMVKHGSSYLRQTIMNVSETVLMHIPSLYDYYNKKHYVEGKPHRVALSHVAKKLVRIMYSLQNSGELFA